MSKPPKGQSGGFVHVPKGGSGASKGSPSKGQAKAPRTKPLVGTGPWVCRPNVIQGLTDALGNVIPVTMSVTEQTLTKELGAPPFGPDDGWSKALPAWMPNPPSWAKQLGHELEQVLHTPRGTLIDPKDAWTNADDRAAVLKALSAKSSGEARAILGDWLMAKGLRWQGVGLRLPLLGPLTGWILNEERPLRRLKGPSPGGQVQVGKMTLVRPHLSERSRQILHAVRGDPRDWPRISEALDDFEKFRGEIKQKIQDFLDESIKVLSQHLPQHQLANLSVWDVYELEEKARKAGNSALAKGLRGVLDKYQLLPLDIRADTEDIGDYLLAELERLAEEDARQRYRALLSFAEKLGAVFGAMPALRATIEAIGRVVWAVRRFSRAMALATGRFLAENLVSDTLVKPILAGYPRAPLIALREIRAYWKTWFPRYEYGWNPEALRRTNLVPKTEAQIRLERMGITRIPVEISASFERAMAVQELQAKSWQEASVWGLPLVRTLRGLPGPLRAVSPPHWLAYLESTITRIARVQESATRLAIFVLRMEELFEREVLPALRGRLRELFALHGLSEDQAETLYREFVSFPDRSPEALRLFLKDRLPERTLLARQAKALHQDLVSEAEYSAIQASRLVNYDYLARTNVDELLSAIFKFHFWATRNLPFYLEEFAKHHALFRNFLRWQMASDEEAERLGLPARIGSMVGLLEMTLFGERVRVYVDLWALISVAAQSDITGLGFYGNPWEQFSRLSASRGMSPHWDLQMLMAMLGYSESDLPPILPVSRSLMRSTGIRAVPPIGVRGLRTAVSGVLPGSTKVYDQSVTGSMAVDRQVWRELVLMSYERTGRPDHPRYRAAFVNPEDPLFHEALRRVMVRQGIGELFYLFLPVPGRAESLTELELRAQAAQSPDVSREEWVAQVRAGDPARWAAFVPDDIRDAQIQAGFALEQVLGVQGKALDPAWAQEHVPWYLRYREWAASRPPGQRSVSQFLRETE